MAITSLHCYLPLWAGPEEGMCLDSLALIPSNCSFFHWYQSIWKDASGRGLANLALCNGFQSGVPGPAAWLAPGRILKIQMLGPHFRCMAPETWRVVLESVF